MGETFGILVAGLLTFFIFSFLYRENPFYRFAEHLVVGVSVGVSFVFTIKNIVAPYLWTPFLKPLLFVRWTSPEMEWWITIPFIIGLGWLMRFNPNYSWLSRYPMAISMGMSAGYGIPLSFKATILVQLRHTMEPLINFATIDGVKHFDLLGTFNALLVFFGVIMVLLYFYFSKAHTGVYGKFTRGGIWILMISFGASFGYTVMARISLLIGRLQFIFTDLLPTIFGMFH